MGELAGIHKRSFCVCNDPEENGVMFTETSARRQQSEPCANYCHPKFHDRFLSSGSAQIPSYNSPLQMGTNIKNLFRQLAQALPGQDEAVLDACVRFCLLEEHSLFAGSQR